MWTALVLLLLICGAVALWDAPDRARRHAAERHSVLDALAALRTAGTASEIAREVAHRTGLRPSDRVVLGHLAGLEEDGLIAVGQREASPEPRYLLLAAPPEARAPEAKFFAPLTIYYDGGCPLCAAEIAHYQRSRGASGLRFADVSELGVAPGSDLAREMALARFHVRDGNGELRSGAAAFATLWMTLPNWRWLGRIVRAAPILPLAEAAYRAFLPLRPWLARAFLVAGIIRPIGSKRAPY